MDEKDGAKDAGASAPETDAKGGGDNPQEAASERVIIARMWEGAPDVADPKGVKTGPLTIYWHDGERERRGAWPREATRELHFHACAPTRSTARRRSASHSRPRRGMATRRASPICSTSAARTRRGLTRTARRRCTRRRARRPRRHEDPARSRRRRERGRRACNDAAARRMPQRPRRRRRAAAHARRQRAAARALRPHAVRLCRSAATARSDMTSAPRPSTSVAQGGHPQRRAAGRGRQARRATGREAAQGRQGVNRGGERRAGPGAPRAYIYRQGTSRRLKGPSISDGSTNGRHGVDPSL